MGGALEYIALGNGILLISLSMVWAFELILRRTRFKHAHRLRLNLTVAALCTAALPFLLAPFAGVLSSSLPTNATDILVSQYLKGNIDLTATQIHAALSAKTSLIDSLISAGPFIAAVVLFVFICAAVLRAIYIGFSIFKVSWLVKDAELLHKAGDVSVHVSDRIDVPFSTRGLFRYHIVFPQSMMHDRHAVKIALSHEVQHIRQRDVDWEILLSLISPLFVLNPAFWLISDRIRQYREYSCDTVLINRGNIDAREYCLLLLDMASKGSASRSSLATSVPLLGCKSLFRRPGKSALQQRLIALTSNSGDEQSGSMNMLPAAGLLALSVLMIAFVATPVGWSHDRLMLSSVVNLERLDRINSSETKPLLNIQSDIQ